MEDTAVLAAPDTAAAPEATEEAFEPTTPDSADGTLATETEGEVEPTDSGVQDASEWENLTPAEIAEKVAEKVAAAEKAKEATLGESYRQREENIRQQAEREQERETARVANQQVEQFRHGTVRQTLNQMLVPVFKEAFDKGTDKPDPAKIDQVLDFATRQSAAVGATQIMNAVQESFRPEFAQRFGDDYASRLEPAQIAAIQRAFDSRNLGAILSTVLDASEFLSEAKVRTRAEAEAAAKAAANTPPAAKPASPRQPSPSRGGSSGGGRATYSTRTEAAAMFANDQITAEEYRRAKSLPW